MTTCARCSVRGPLARSLTRLPASLTTIDGPPSSHGRVRDNGPGPATDGAVGHGLAGMRERVAMAGGTLWTGPGSLGGFVVHAELPVADAW